MEEYTPQRMKEVLHELGITPYKSHRVDGNQAAKILTWRLKTEQGINRIYTTTAIRRRVDTGALPVADRINTRLNLYDLKSVFHLSLYPGRAEGARQRLLKHAAS